jgi:hypothetical protein
VDLRTFGDYSPGFIITSLEDNAIGGPLWLFSQGNISQGLGGGGGHIAMIPSPDKNFSFVFTLNISYDLSRMHITNWKVISVAMPPNHYDELLQYLEIDI